MMTTKTIAVAFVWLPFAAIAQKPTNLTTDLLEHTDRVYVGGLPSTIGLADTGLAIEPWQCAAIRSALPWLGWVVNGSVPNTVQTAYRVLVATKRELLTEGKADMWDSGEVKSGNSSGVVYAGKPLKASTVYYWAVQTRDNHGSLSGYSDPKAFRTAAVLDGETARYPLEKTEKQPMGMSRLQPQTVLADFGYDAFGQLKLTVSTEKAADTLTIHLGEQLADGRVNRRPEGSQRYAVFRLPLLRGTHTYYVKPRKDKRNTASRQNESGVDPILMPEYIGEVFPFRYCEVQLGGATLADGGMVRAEVHYPFDRFASSFSSSDSVLNAVWQLCKRTVEATSFCGTYVDGDRERIPYEADAIINQLSHYAVDRDFAMARHSVKHLIYNPTWPTEWILQSGIMAWNDYMYTGDTRLLASVYEDLKAKTLMALRNDNGLISTRTGKATQQVLDAVYFKGKRLRDIVDWPQSGAEGIEKENGGETDGFVFTDYNTVVNAYHCEALRLLSLTAAALGKQAEADLYAKEARKATESVNRLLVDGNTRLYTDGIGTRHSSLHSNMFALCFGLVPQDNRQAVVDFIKSRKMACSVYGSQFLLDALYDAGDADYALSLLNSTARRSWYNMTRIGSTITTEAWDNVYKPNQDWNHPWGAAPTNVIVRKLMGVEPLEPGFSKMRIKPQPGSLRSASLTVPTIKGTVSVTFDNRVGENFTLDVDIPANTTAEVWLPKLAKRISVDGKMRSATAVGGFVKTTIGSGKHRIAVGKGK